jgi:cobalt-precorrin-7 (C5)-methyltransferase
VIIIGVGAGPKMLTEEAIDALQRAEIIYGSIRAIKLVRNHIRPNAIVKAIDDYKKLDELPENAIVLSTGDPMLSGLGYLPGKVIPGISSLQIACARLKISQIKVIPMTFHGRNMNPEAVAFELRSGRCVFLLTDRDTDLAGLCDYLECQDLSSEVAVFKDLGYPKERILRGCTAAPPNVSELSCVLIGQFS